LKLEIDDRERSLGERRSRLIERAADATLTPAWRCGANFETKELIGF
jgi:hypothetical protein